MEIIEALKHSGTPFEIPDATRVDLPEFFKKMGYKVGLELGTYKGEYTREFCKVGLKMYTVDAWESYGDYHSAQINNDARMARAYRKAIYNLKDYKDCTIIKKFASDALNDFADGSLDFVYIDCNHSFKYVAADLVDWSNKVRKGGVVCGHDYFVRDITSHEEICQVAYVVDAYTKAFSIPNWYVIGRKDAPEGEKCDRWRSWFWIK